MSFFLKRMRHYWRILLTLALGIILATAMLVCGPLLVDTVMNFTLPYRLQDSDPITNNLRITTYNKLDQTEYVQMDEQLRSIFSQRLAEHIALMYGAAASGWAYPWINGQLTLDQRIAPCFYEYFPDKVTFIAGNWPSGAVLLQDTLQVVVSETFANTYGLQVGDKLGLSQKINETEPTYWLSITGIVRPTDPQDIYWYGKYSPVQNQAVDRWNAQFFVFIPKEQFFSISEQLFPSLSLTLNWNVIIEPSGFKVGDISPTYSQIKLLKADLKELPASFSVETKLDQTLIKYAAQEQIIRITMYVLIVEVLLLALYYVGMMSSISNQLIEGEFSTLSSRGASFKQLFIIQSTDALLISASALIIGPTLAILMIYSLAKFGPLADIAPSDWSLSMTSTAWIAAGVSVIVCILGMILPIRALAKQSVVAHTRSMSRTERPPWWQRYYLDVFILITALILLWRMRFYGSVASSTGAGHVDWLLVLSPMLLLLGSATILLRIFPPILRLFSRIASRGRGITTVLALWQTSRNPAHVARLVLLLTLTMAMGILASGINATLDGSEYERTFYATGSDIRLAFNGLLPLHEINGVSGVNASSAVWRGSGTSNVRIHDVIPSFDILAIEPVSFSHVTRYRSDYAVQPMGELLSQLVSTSEAYESSLIPLPGKPSHVGLWIYDWTLHKSSQLANEQPLDNLMINAKLQTTDHQVFVVRLTPIIGADTTVEDSQWVYFDAVLPELPPESYPLLFHSFWYTVSRTLPSGQQVNLLLDDFSIIDAETGQNYIFEGFEKITRIWHTNSQSSPINFTKTLPTHGGDASILLLLPREINSSGYSLMPVSSSKSITIPALFSKELLTSTETKVGDKIVVFIQGARVSVEIIGEVDYFPTLYEQSGHGFLVVPRDALINYLNLLERAPVNPNEIWVETRDEQISNQVQINFPEAIKVWEFNAERRFLEADALTLGLRSVTFLAYILTTILCLVGFATHFYIHARQREMQFGILRSLGLSPGQLYGWLLLEQIIMILAGLSLGTLFGMLLNRLILPGLPISFGDRPAIPPFIPLENWNAVFQLYLALLITFLVTLGIAAGLLWRSNIHRALKIGQE